MVTPDDQTPTVEDAQIVTTGDESPIGSVEPVANDATILSDLESLIKSHIRGLDTRRNDLKKVREMVNDALVNDSTYRDHEKAAKEAAKLKSATKSQILKMPANAQMVSKAQELSAEIKEMDDALSDYLREFQRISGSNEIETDDGQVREIVYTAKLIKKSSR
jgi:hypothetical protein